MTRITLKLVHYLLNLRQPRPNCSSFVGGTGQAGRKKSRYKELASRMFPSGYQSLSSNEMETDA